MTGGGPQEAPQQVTSQEGQPLFSHLWGREEPWRIPKEEAEGVWEEEKVVVGKTELPGALETKGQSWGVDGLALGRRGAWPSRCLQLWKHKPWVVGEDFYQEALG